jgi:hypothetical protein
VPDISPFIEFLPYASLGLGATGMAVASWIVIKNRQFNSSRAAASRLTGTDKLRLLAEQKQTADRLITATSKAQDTIDRIEQARNELAAGATELEQYLSELKQRQDAASASLQMMMRSDQAGGVVETKAGQSTVSSGGQPHQSRGRRQSDSGTRSTAEDRGSDVLPRDALTQQVLQLSHEGHGPQSIAQATGLHIGVVELMLSLRR